MENQFQLQTDGQAILQSDINGLGQTSGLADDRVFAELFRIAPKLGSTVSKGILHTGGVLVAPNGASGSVVVSPFRALVGSRSLVAAGAKANWRDGRSGLSVTDAQVVLSQVVSLAANASGNPRWDAVYAITTVDADSATVTRKVKSPITGVVADTSVSVTKVTTVSVAVVTGTPGATPAFPALSADTSSIFYSLLAYVRVPDGFGAGTTVSPKDIDEVATMVSITRAMGVTSARPANQHNIVGGTAISSAGTSTGNGILKWTGAAATRPALYMPPSMTGGEQIITVLDLANAASANWSHQHGDVIDDSIDWRKRLFKWHAQVADSDRVVAWKSVASNNVFPVVSLDAPGASPGGIFADAVGLGQSFANDDAINATHAHVATLVSAGNIPNTVMVAATVIDVYVNLSTGKMHVAITGVPLCCVFLWIEATGPYGNV